MPIVRTVFVKKTHFLRFRKTNRNVLQKTRVFGKVCLWVKHSQKMMPAVPAILADNFLEFCNFSNFAEMCLQKNTLKKWNSLRCVRVTLRGAGGELAMVMCKSDLN